MTAAAAASPGAVRIVKRHTGVTAPLVIEVVGEPIPQGSKTRTRFAVREDNPRTAPWRATVAAMGAVAMEGREPLAGAVHLEVLFSFPRPRSHYGTGKNAGSLRPSAPKLHTVRPDLDKLMRAVGDALSGIVWRDDSQIASLEAVKVYGSPGCTITVSEVTSREPF